MPPRQNVTPGSTPCHALPPLSRTQPLTRESADLGPLGFSVPVGSEVGAFVRPYSTVPPSYHTPAALPRRARRHSQRFAPPWSRPSARNGDRSDPALRWLRHRLSVASLTCSRHLVSKTCQSICAQAFPGALAALQLLLFPLGQHGL